MKEFHLEHGRWPEYKDFHSGNGLPRTRTLERSYGGLVSLRKQLGIHADMRTGEARSLSVMNFNERGRIAEDGVYQMLLGHFQEPFIHSQYPISNKTKHRADWCIFYGSGKKVIIDAFWPVDMRSFVGCLNSKIRKHKHYDEKSVPVIFLHMNKEMNDHDVNDFVDRKKIKLASNQSVMSICEFEEFIKTIK